MLHTFKCAFGYSIFIEFVSNFSQMFSSYIRNNIVKFHSKQSTLLIYDLKQNIYKEFCYGGIALFEQKCTCYIFQKKKKKTSNWFFFCYDNVVININVQCNKAIVEISLEKIDIEFFLIPPHMCLYIFPFDLNCFQN